MHDRRNIPWRVVGILLVAVALLVNAVLGVTLIVTREQVKTQEADRVQLLQCTQQFNALTGKANDARDERARESTTAAVILWQEVIKALTQPQTDTVLPFVISARQYIKRLHQTNKTRDNIPFPPPDMCTNIGKGVHQ